LKIVIIRPAAIGDTLLTFPVIESLRARYAPAPNLHITLVGNAAVLPLARVLGLVEAVYAYDEPRWAALFTTQPSRLDAALAGVLRDADLVVAWLRDPEGLVARKLRFFHVKQAIIVPGRPAEGERVHIVEYLARSLGLTLPPTPCYAPRLRAATEPDLATAKPARCVAIHPGSGGARKCWSPEHFMELIPMVWQRGYAVLLLAGPADHERLATITRKLPAPPRAEALTTLVDKPLFELAQRLLDCCGYIGNDSGITHLAALLGLPTLALFGPSDPRVWRPYGRTVRVVHELDLAHLSPHEVMSNLQTSGPM
jgi:ADP-heptose:LPS heptosyltransferase